MNVAYQYLLQGDYLQASSLFEESIVENPSQSINYCYLGLAYLLQGQEESAHTTWLTPLMEASEEEASQYSAELFQVLQAEANRQEEIENHQIAWVIRKHAQQIFPGEINNLLKIVFLSIDHLQASTSELLVELCLIDNLGLEDSDHIDDKFLLAVVENVLEHISFDLNVLEFVEACLPHVPSQAFIDVLIQAALKLNFIKGQPQSAVKLLEICLRIQPDNWQTLFHLANFYQNSGDYVKGIEVSKAYQSLCEAPIQQADAAYLLLRGLLGAGGCWKEALDTFSSYISLLSKLTDPQEDIPKGFRPELTARLFNLPFFLPYFEDNSFLNRRIQNYFSTLGSKQLRKLILQEGKKSYYAWAKDTTEILKIGFVSHCFSQHSVGWLSRWFFRHYDREKFQIYLYFNVIEPESAFSQQWFLDNVYQAHSSTDSLRLAEQIYDDQINVLIDLDSITLDTTCEIMALKPAPVQVTWLGWDASGVPTVDYFIADPYVLPENAQEYYSETVWRLPQTYIAVDGFEVDVPTLRRENLDIPADAVVYLSAQRGYKRHPDTARLQLQILKQVPNSYFLVKGLGDQEAVQKFFVQLAEEEGVDPGRLRFPPLDRSEPVHRANLGIADVVLDTYPYNGATTTLETLWMGIPLVTRVGQQFAARNSYAFMMNVGVTEGIAWTDEEYVEWGVRLGKDEQLRQQIAWKLRQSRQTSPLWNAKQFTREMEKAFQQMWARYVGG